MALYQYFWSPKVKNDSMTVKLAKLGFLTGFLFARPSLLEGMGRVLDLSGTMNVYNISRSPQEADLRALLSDWLAVGGDLWAAVDAFECEHGQTLQEQRKAITV